VFLHTVDQFPLCSDEVKKAWGCSSNLPYESWHVT
jgi:hypothetical protein